MADSPNKVVQKVQQAVESKVGTSNPSAIGYLRSWASSPAPPAITATLIAAQHLQPVQLLPLTFAPLLMFSSYLNLAEFPVDAAGTSAAWSGLYLLLANRRKQTLRNKWSVRGAVRGTTIGMCAVNLVAGGFLYATGRRKDEISLE